MGFSMNRDKKLFIADNFEELLTTGKITVYDKETVQEFGTFVHSGEKMEAMMGKYDNRVISCMLGCLGLKPVSKADIPTFQGANNKMISNFLNEKEEPQRRNNSLV